MTSTPRTGAVLNDTDCPSTVCITDTGFVGLTFRPQTHEQRATVLAEMALTGLRMTLTDTGSLIISLPNVRGTVTILPVRK